MLVIKTADLTQNFKQIADSIINHGEKVLITRPHNQNLVLITEREYKELARVHDSAEIEKRRSMVQSLSGILPLDTDYEAARTERIATHGLL